MSYGNAPAPPPPPAASHIPPKKGWFSRNWKWFVPLVVLTPILLIGLFAGVVLTFVFGLLKSSEPYKHGVEVVMRDPRAQQALGPPVKIGRLVSGNVNTTLDSGEADLGIPVYGSAHEGKVYVIAKKSAGVWHYEKIQLWLEGQPSGLDLLTHTTVSPEER
ncbi:MAG TPA: cytochrome c oxidase assembly factor Coa1 family protein [Verrucomicrobiae bacterium]|jgi:hypothetical protein|nr:cytochrome c oxidase assembly factor Coa1 family protein [Verrucomicrobiae bacterium]